MYSHMYHLQSEDTVKRAAQYKKTSYNKSNTLKATYENKCKDADRADENNSRLHSNPQAKAKELTQSAKKMEVGAVLLLHVVLSTV